METTSEAEQQGERVIAGHGVDIPTLAQFLMLQQETGTLELTANGKAGKIFFEGGQIIDAQDARPGDPEDELFRLLQWEDDTFVFCSTEKATPKKIEKDTQALFLELAVRMDEENGATAEEDAAGLPEEVAIASGAYA